MSARVLAALIALTLVACGRSEPLTRENPPDIILITIDTLRADSVGFAGKKEVETPFLDQLACESVVFTNAHAHNVVTLPSHTNILTGLYPYQHGVRDNAGYALDSKFQAIAPLLKQRGYATGAFIGGFPLDGRFGLGLGVFYAKTGRVDPAIETWRKAVGIDPHLYDAMFNLAVVSGQNSRWDVAREALTQFISTAPPARYARELAAAREMLREVERRTGANT